jgi:D-lyxose ketol-isomerase
MTRDEVLSVVALYETACGVAKNVPEMKEFLPFYRQQMTPKHLKVIKRYDKIKRQGFDDLVTMFEAKYPDKKKPSLEDVTH